MRHTWAAPIGDEALLVGAALAAALLLGLQAADLGATDAVSGAVVIFVSVTVEALPFILLGALVSAAIATLVPDRVFTRIGSLPRSLQVPGAALGGVAFPVCECGSVPVARRLVLRGLDGSAAVAFMLAAPILNPVVVASTAIAFQGSDALEITLGRVALGLIVAVAAGALLGRLVRVRADPTDLEGIDAYGHDHSSEHRSMPGRGSTPGRLRLIADHTSADLIYMGRFVVAGAALTAIVQTLVPTSVLTGIGDSWLLGPIVLMAVAFVLSLCSEADAFVAASFSQFTPGAQVAFLAFGPVLDLKLVLLYGATFGRRFVIGLAALAVPAVLAASIALQAVVFG